MQYTKLSNTDLNVSKICLGTMTWGEQNTEAEGHQQMDYAFAQGVNFFDTAELYPVPARKQTQGETERIIGSWFTKTKNRNKVILASKIAGPALFTKHIRTGGYTQYEIDDAIDQSLKRLQTDYIDLYQLHWPERTTNYFGLRDYVHPSEQTWKYNFNEVLHALDKNIKAGKIRHLGLSNEGAWGVMRFNEEAKYGRLPKMISVQNPYSLLNRTDEQSLSEILHREDIGYLAYSPLGFGVLSGKYRNGANPKKARISLFPNFARYSGKNSTKATECYYRLAQKNGLSLTQMALAFVNQRPFVSSTIIGATSLDQLKENIGSIEVSLSPEILKEIDEIHNNIPNPAP